jgi:hypothetical protein
MAHRPKLHLLPRTITTKEKHHKNEIHHQTAKETTEKIANKFIEWVKTMDPNKPSNTEKSITHK